jgi:hypothetical protein
MKAELEAFALQIPDLASKKPSELISYFAYFLTVVQQEAVVTGVGIARCFEVLRHPAYSSVSTYFSRNSGRGSSHMFVKAKGGYQLSRNAQLDIQKSLHAGPAKLETSLLLRALLPKVVEPQEREFLMESIDCYEIGARRSAIVMTWLLTIYHLQKHILDNHLTAFNAVLAADKGVKLNSIANFDDFGEIKEAKLIELMRAAKVISNDVRKILDVKLGIRNSAAHPSAVTISEVKATEFIIDLVENVVLKY